MHNYCHVSMPIAAQVIGMYTLSIAIFMLNLVMSIFISRNNDDNFFEMLNNWSLLGINWVQSMKYLDTDKKVQFAATCLLMYALSLLIASLYLTIGRQINKYRSAEPWLFLQMISILDQMIGVSFYLTHNEQKHSFEKSVWYIGISTLVIFINSYFWILVQNAYKKWYEDQNNRMNSNTNTFDRKVLSSIPTINRTMASVRTSTPTSSSSSTRKSPSYFWQMFTSPTPNKIEKVRLGR